MLSIKCHINTCGCNAKEKQVKELATTHTPSQYAFEINSIYAQIGFG